MLNNNGFEFCPYLSVLSCSFISASTEQKHARRALNKKCSKCWYFTIENVLTNFSSKHPTACFTLHVCCTQNKKKWKHSHGVTFKVVTAIFFLKRAPHFKQRTYHTVESNKFSFHTLSLLLDRLSQNGV